jgi:hypothetical protein
MGFIKSIPGTFVNSDIIAGVLPVSYPAVDIESPLIFVVFNSAVTSETQTYMVEKVSDHACNINIGDQYKSGTWKYRLLYAN